MPPKGVADQGVSAAYMNTSFPVHHNDPVTSSIFSRLTVVTYQCVSWEILF